MSIKHWPEATRPREKLMANGSSALSDAELLAIFLRTGIPGLDAVALAESILSKFGNLKTLFNASLAEFCDGPGLGPAKYVQLQAVLELSRRYLSDVLNRTALASPDEARQFLLSQMSHLEREQFACLWLDNQHRVIDYEVLFQGTIDSANVYPREVIKSALYRNAAAVILAHNHPSGIAEPSRADQIITNRIGKALSTVDVRLLDHMVVGDGIVISFAERGLL